jgi:SNF family Na+-dependent transporter
MGDGSYNWRGDWFLILSFYSVIGGWTIAFVD